MHVNGVPGFMLPGLILYIFDLLLRGIQLVNTASLTPGQDISIHGSIITVSLRWKPGSVIKPGQTVYLRFPSVSIEGHPFSVAGVEEVSESPGGDRGFVHTLLHFRAGKHGEGSMTHKLKTKLLDLQLRGNSLQEMIQAQVEGPYWVSGCMPQDNVVVMVIGGIGITPALGLLRAWAAAAAKGASDAVPKAVHLLWSARSVDELQLLDNTLIDMAWYVYLVAHLNLYSLL